MEGILEYINVLEDAQTHSICADNNKAFLDHDFMLIASSAILATEWFPHTTKKWVELLTNHQQKMWAERKTINNNTEVTAKVHTLATGDKDQFGLAHCAAEGA